MKSYPYKQKLSTALVGTAIFGFAAFGPIDLVVSNKAGLLINHLIYLPPRLATAFYAFGSLVSWVGFAGCVFLLVMAISVKREVRLLSNRLEAPRGGFSKEKVVIPYGSIKKVEIFSNGNARFLYVHHHRGRLTLVPALLPKKSDLDEIYEFLLSHTPG